MKELEIQAKWFILKMRELAFHAKWTTLLDLSFIYLRRCFEYNITDIRFAQKKLQHSL